ncbi:proto-oncogene tyrosine- kinase receptor Ret, partial [Paramuricea clavata]
EEPYPEISPFETFTLVASGKRMERPPQCSEELYELMKKCWEHEQENRPSFHDIHEQLKGMLAETDHRAYTNVVEMCEEGSDVLTDDRRISLESLGDLRYTKG